MLALHDILPWYCRGGCSPYVSPQGCNQDPHHSTSEAAVCECVSERVKTCHAHNRSHKSPLSQQLCCLKLLCVSEGVSERFKNCYAHNRSHKPPLLQQLWLPGDTGGRSTGVTCFFTLFCLQHARLCRLPPGITPQVIRHIFAIVEGLKKRQQPGEKTTVSLLVSSVIPSTRQALDLGLSEWCRRIAA